MINCKDCIFWKHTTESWCNITKPLDEDTFEPKQMPFEVRYCESPLLLSRERPLESNQAACIDGSNYYAKLVTGPDFGCANGKSEQKEPEQMSNADPKLIELKGKMQDLLKEYDVFGTVTLSSKSYTQFWTFYPTWSLASLDEESGRLSFYAMRKDFKNSLEHNKAANSTVGSLLSIRDIGIQNAMAYDEAIKHLKKVSDLNIDHRPIWVMTDDEIDKV